MSRKPEPHERLKKWREGRSLTQTDAAAMLSMDLSTYNALEHGRKRPGLSWAFKIEDATRGAVRARHWSKTVNPRRDAPKKVA